MSNFDTNNALEAAREALQRDVDDLLATAQAAYNKYEEAKERLANFDLHVAGDSSGGGVKKAAPGKPGRKKRTTSKKKRAKRKTTKKRAPKTSTKRTTKKRAPKKTSTKKVAKKGKGKVSAATKGRRAVAEGLRPPLKEAIKTVMGNKTMDAGEIIECLTKKNWLPDSDKPRDYISFALSSGCKDTFERVSRGKYRVRDNVKTAAPKKGRKKGRKAKKADTQKLAEIGVKGEGNVADNPFAG